MRKVTLILYILIFISFIVKSITYTAPKSEEINDANSKNSENSKIYEIYIDVDENKLSLFENGVLLKTYPCASGEANTPSPVGFWKIVNKDSWGEGFGGTWLGLNVPWAGMIVELISIYLKLKIILIF